MSNLKLRVKGNNVGSYINKIIDRLDKESAQAINDVSKKLTRYVQKRYLSGHSARSLGQVSGELHDSTRPLVVRKNSKNIVGGVVIGDSEKARKYVDVHVSPSPKVTTITPKNKKWLAIPLAKAKDSRGVQKMKPREVPNGVFRFTKQGKNAKKAFIGRYSGKNFVPYFLLLKSVRIPSRVHTNEIMRKYSPTASRLLNRALSNIVKGD